MRCEVEYCVYNRDFVCLLKSIEINSLGMCSDCIIIALERNFLESEKERQLWEMEQS